MSGATREKKVEFLAVCAMLYMYCPRKSLTPYQEAFSKYLASNSSSSKQPASSAKGKEKRGKKKGKSQKEKPSLDDVEVIGAPTYQNQNIHFWAAAMLGVGNVCQ